MKDGILTEVKSGNCVADLLWLNGTSIAYEIKTEIDTNRRLTNQINSYHQLFKQTVVVSYERNIDTILPELPEHVGVMFLNKEELLKFIGSGRIHRTIKSRINVLDFKKIRI